MPAKSDLEKLAKKDYRKYARLKNIMRQYSKTGKLPPSKLDRYSGTNLMKFKHSETYPYRVPCFRHSGDMVLTHVFRKKGNREIQKEIEKAEQIRKEHLGKTEG